VGRVQERPRFAVWGGRMNLRVQVEPLVTTALQASSNRGMHTARHRSSLKVKHWLNRTLNSITNKTGPMTDLRTKQTAEQGETCDFPRIFERPILGRIGQKLAAGSNSNFSWRAFVPMKIVHVQVCTEAQRGSAPRRRNTEAQRGSATRKRGEEVQRGARRCGRATGAGDRARDRRCARSRWCGASIQCDRAARRRARGTVRRRC
jgi:hypothetical protein